MASLFQPQTQYCAHNVRYHKSEENNKSELATKEQILLMKQNVKNKRKKNISEGIKEVKDLLDIATTKYFFSSEMFGLKFSPTYIEQNMSYYISIVNTAIETVESLIKTNKKYKAQIYEAQDFYEDIKNIKEVIMLEDKLMTGYRNKFKTLSGPILLEHEKMQQKLSFLKKAENLYKSPNY